MSSSVYEAAGVYASEGTQKGWIIVKEVKSGLALEVDYRLVLSVEEARCFADQIWRMADDVQGRHNNGK